MASTPLTPQQIITQFESLIEDSLDLDTEIFLLNDVKNSIEEDEEWAILKACDMTQVANVGDTYLSFKQLPDDFGLPSQRGIYVGTDLVPYIQVDFEDRIRWQSVSHRWYLDLANNQYALCGSANPGGTIQFFYQKQSPDLVVSTDPEDDAPWIFPARFHSILPKLMAVMYPAIDQPDKSRAWDDRWNEFATKQLEIMRRWNARMLRQASANGYMTTDLSSYPNIIDMGDGGVGGGAYG